MAFNFDTGQVVNLRNGIRNRHRYLDRDERPRSERKESNRKIRGSPEHCFTFNKESMPKRLGNWEVPRWAPTKPRPLEMRPSSKPICDINGHFLPGAPRGSSKCFGHYTGTWDLPRKITRKVAEELAKEPPDGRFSDWLNLRVQRPSAVGSSRTRGGKRAKGQEDIKTPIEPQTFQDPEYTENQTKDFSEPIDKIQEELHQDKETEKGDPLKLNENKLPIDEDGRGPYVPGLLTNPDKRHDSHEILVKDAIKQIHGIQENEDDKFWRKVAENASKNEKDNEDMKYDKKGSTPKLPSVNVARNFQFAKKMHVGNLEHQPLPDTLGYRNLKKIGEHRDSDIIVKPYAISWKGYGASGPTCCTKMRVHRPKTCDQKKNDDNQKQDMRPSTSAPDLGGQYKKPMSLMDLAICWDFKSEDPKREPRPPKHIDGSNGSKAPAVFTMVHASKEEVDMPLSHADPIFNQNKVADNVGHHPVPYFQKDMTKERRKNSCEVQNCPQHNTPSGKNSTSGSSSRRSSDKFVKNTQCDGIHGCGTPLECSRKPNHENRPDKLQPVKDAWDSNKPQNDANKNRNSLESYEKTPLAQGKLVHSSPNESETSRRSFKDRDTSTVTVKHKNCLSCNGMKVPQEIKSKEDYKFAFKAGNPNSVQSVTSSTNSKGIKIPKMRHPYTKKSYTIPTLAPPFSIWRDANATGYPEHWRLASVYQHAYKPPEQRRKPLIDSVYQ